MGLWNSIRTAVLGVDLEEEQRRSDAADAAIRVENEKDYAPGGPVYVKIVEERGVEAANAAYEDVQERNKASEIDVEREVNEAFNEGLDEGAANIRGTIAAPFNWSFSIIPWQVWAAVALWFFLVYLGGWKALKGILFRR